MSTGTDFFTDRPVPILGSALLPNSRYDEKSCMRQLIEGLAEKSKMDRSTCGLFSSDLANASSGNYQLGLTGPSFGRDMLMVLNNVQLIKVCHNVMV